LVEKKKSYAFEEAVKNSDDESEHDKPLKGMFVEEL
jgi:hypothetical protein